MNTVQVYLTRHDLLALLAKLDMLAKLDKNESCTIIKCDADHPTHPIRGASEVVVTAVEDRDYYTDSHPNEMCTRSWLTPLPD